MLNNSSLLSVCLITYNHANYIRNAIDGVLMQKVSYSWELVIADDCSTDGTREILLEYKEKYPQIIHLIFRDKNVGATQNWIELLSFPKSKYIAYIEGDDYWTNPLKLQKQIIFLENSIDFTLCFHSAKEFIEKNNVFKIFSNVSNKEYSGKEILKEWIIPSSSIVFRKSLITDEFKNIASNYQLMYGDIFLFLYACEYGKIYGLSEEMSIYRRHKSSTTQKSFGLGQMNKMLNHYRFICSLFNNKYKSEIKIIITEQAFYFGHTCILNKNYFNAIQMYFKSFYYSPFHFYITLCRDINNRIK